MSDILKVASDPYDQRVMIILEEPAHWRSYSFITREDLEVFISILEEANQNAFSGAGENAMTRTIRARE